MLEIKLTCSSDAEPRSSVFLFSVYISAPLSVKLLSNREKPLAYQSSLSHICPCFSSLLCSNQSPFPFRHNQRSLEVQKDSVHKNRCHVRFPEVFSSFPYKVNVTAVNALGKAFTTISFEESSIGKIQQMTCHTFILSLQVVVK